MSCVSLRKAGIPRRRHGHRHGLPCQHPREDRREDVRVGVGVGVGVVEFQLNSLRYINLLLLLPLILVHLSEFIRSQLTESVPNMHVTSHTVLFCELLTLGDL